MILLCAICPITRYISSIWPLACVMHNAAFVSAIMYLVEATGIGKSLHILQKLVQLKNANQLQSNFR